MYGFPASDFLKAPGFQIRQKLLHRDTFCFSAAPEIGSSHMWTRTKLLLSCSSWHTGLPQRITKHGL